MKLLKIVLLVLTLCAACALARADETLFDLEAKYWAREIAVNKTLTYDALQKDVAKWDITPVHRTAFLKKVKENIKTKNYAPLTQMESARVAEYKTVQNTLAKKQKNIMPKGDIDAQIDSLRLGAFDIIAKYWANRIVDVQDITYDTLYNDAKKWYGSEEIKGQLLLRVDRYVKGNNTELTDEEMRILNAEVQAEHNIIAASGN